MYQFEYQEDQHSTRIHDQSALPVFLVAFVIDQHVKGIVTNMCIPVAASPQDLEL